METRANYVIVGIFTLAAILAAFAFVYWTAAIGDKGETVMLRVRIPGSASGLGRGSFVLFNGVKVGDVKRVYIDVNNPTAAIADTEVDRTTPITKSTQADIGLAGLTGQANVELKGADPKEVKILDEAEKNGTIAEITANPSAVTSLLETAQNIFTRADKVLSELEGFTKDVRGPLTQTVQNAQQFSDALAKNSGAIDKFLASVSSLSDELQGVSGKLDTMVKSANDILTSVDRDKIKDIVANVDAVTANLKQTSQRLDGVLDDAHGAIGSVNDFVKNTQTTLAKVNGVLDSVDTAELRAILDNVRRTSENADKAASNVAQLTGKLSDRSGDIEQTIENVNKASADVAEVTDKFSKRADDIDHTIVDARQLAQRLNDASVRVDGILAKVDKLLGSGQADGVMADARATLKSFKQVADTLNARLGVITDNLARFSGQGLQNVEALVQDSRRSINRIEEAVTDLSRNPQRILSGGEGEVRQYDGRARR